MKLRVSAQSRVNFLFQRNGFEFSSITILGKAGETIATTREKGSRIIVLKPNISE